MKRFLVVLVAILIPLAMFSQAQIKTKKALIDDFPEKVTKVVLSGNAFIDTELERAVKSLWRVSPYEFCSLEDFNSLKNSPDYYFLMIIRTRFPKEASPGVEMLSLIKGGKRADKGLDRMLEVVSVPLRSADYPSGREMVFIPALVDIIQTHALASMDSDRYGYVGLQVHSKNLGGAYDVRIVLAEGDMAFDLSEASAKRLSKKDMVVLPNDDADTLMGEMAGKTMVSYCVYPERGGQGSSCYNMLIGADDHKLYYFSRYTIKNNSDPGFRKKDISRILKW